MSDNLKSNFNLKVRWKFFDDNAKLANYIAKTIFHVSQSNSIYLVNKNKLKKINC